MKPSTLAALALALQNNTPDVWETSIDRWRPRGSSASVHKGPKSKKVQKNRERNKAAAKSRKRGRA